MNGFDNKVFVIDKASGPTSFDIVAALRRLSGIRKVGHAGTLDPLARGVLLLCTETATRAVEHFMDLEKEYEFDVRLGAETTTLDAEGEVVREAPVPPISLEAAREAAGSFVGEYTLTPPPFSALKRGGRRMYEMARAGEATEIPRRKVRIHGFDIVGLEPPLVRCVVRCSRGTYVRSLAKDLGDRLGVPAHIASLTRTRIGPFTRDHAFPSEKLTPSESQALRGLPLEEALAFLPAIVISSRAKHSLLYGALPLKQDIVRVVGPQRWGAVRILDEEGTLLAVGTRAGPVARDPLRAVDSFRLYVAAHSAPTGGASRSPW